MSDSASVISKEFDRLALITESADGWTQNSHYHGFLLRRVPANCRRALEVGCGTGDFSRRLAGRAEHLTALDLSPEMIRMARERSSEFKNIEFDVADAVERDFPDEEFDCVATIATMHHLPMKHMLSKFRRALRPGGVLLVLDLVEPEGFYDRVTNALALPACVGLRLLHQHRFRAPASVRAAWAEHEKFDTYPTLVEVRKACAELLPGAEVRRHLLWRYSLIWRKVVV
ncbi:MAG TPA: class I SAM-dependent methyltransferase [Pyrinomonadaceae bacterium]|jgi:ubiquinone/menaquinone biosynthesis C-methylase UbiE